MAVRPTTGSDSQPIRKSCSASRAGRKPGLASARHLGLLGLNLLPGLKREVMWQNLGFGRQA